MSQRSGVQVWRRNFGKNEDTLARDVSMFKLDSPRMFAFVASRSRETDERNACSDFILGVSMARNLSRVIEGSRAPRFIV